MGFKIFKNNTLFFFSKSKITKRSKISPKPSMKKKKKKPSANIPKASTIKIQTLLLSPPLIIPSNHHVAL